ncbi:MAG: aldolase catalytic domain-containing protein [Candidatus Brocadiia bacterium]
MYRPEIKVMDCTVRDGGLMNNWQFTDEFVRAVYLALSAAGVDYMEIGYKSSDAAFSRKENGPWKFCDEAPLRRIVGDHKTAMKLSAMADIGRIEFDDIPPKSESQLSMIRVACYVNQMDKAIALAEHCMDKGYETTINLMAMSKVMERDLDEALNDLSKSRVPVFYIVDSFGAMYSEQVDVLVKKCTAALPGKTLGFHGHNNQQLAFANTIEAIIRNCNRLDGSLYGIGRGAGNCPIELLMAFLKNPKFDLRPVLAVIQSHLLPLQKSIEWGYHIPYLITGALNEHPRSAMKFMADADHSDFVRFYDQMTEVTPLE